MAERELMEMDGKDREELPAGIVEGEQVTEEYRFVNETTLTPEDFSALHAAWEKYKSPLKGMRVMQRICFALPGVFLLMVGGSSFWSALTGGAEYAVSAVISVAFMGVGALLVFWPFGKDGGRRGWRRYPDKGMILRFNFGPDSFFQITDAARVETRYDTIRDIMMNPKIFLLFFEDRSVYILHKDGFLTGDAEGFQFFLEEKTGISVKEFC